MINGNVYMTDTLASLAQFNVKIQDANGCVSNLIIDDYNCDCGAIDAGELDSIPTEICIDKCVPIKTIIPPILDPEDVVMYVFHQSSYNDLTVPKLDTFFSLNDVVCFDATKGMITGKAYYITCVVGMTKILMA